MSDTTDALPEKRLAEIWAALDPVDEWRPHIKAAIAELTSLRVALAQAGAGREPVATVGDLIIQVRERVVSAGIRNNAPLYAHPSPAQREPLSDAQMLACVRSVGVPAPMGLTRDRGPYEVTEPTWFLIQLVGAIERAHGITDSGTKGAAS